MKWCSRIAVTACGSPSLLDAKDVFLEAQDCFSAPLPKMEDRNLLDMAVGAKLGLTKEKIEFFFRSYKPNVHTSPLSLTVGRITLRRKIQDNKPVQLSHTPLPKYAHTRHSLVLLEKVAASIRNNEPVLLVGETGTGKTSTVQYLAAHCGTTLKVVNMSQQSDSSDLLGGYKPVEMKQIVAPVREKFELLFCKTFSRKQNVKFLSHVQNCFAQGRWEMLFKLMMHCQKNAVERVKKGEKLFTSYLVSLSSPEINCCCSDNLSGSYFQGDSKGDTSMFFHGLLKVVEMAASATQLSSDLQDVSYARQTTELPRFMPFTVIIVVTSTEQNSDVKLS